MESYRIAVYGGDGIGAEVVAQAVRVLQAVQEKQRGFALETTEFPWGVSFWAETGTLVPPDYLDTLRAFDAILFGATGDPARVPDHLTAVPLQTIRKRYDQYACVRPSKLYQGVRCPLAGKGPDDVDLIVLRENSEGEYAACGGFFRTGYPDETALQTAIHTRRGIERILRFGFELALSRRKHLTMVTKSNALQYGLVLWDQILKEVRGEYPSVEVDKQHVDAAAMNLVCSPERFDVMVMSNLFGDILSEIGSAIGGGLGLAPSANINPERTFPSLFEPTHGSAPDIVGKGIANPIGSILSAAMMLDWLGQSEPAQVVQRAVGAVLSQGLGTPDLGGTLSTEQLADKIIEHL